MYKKILSSIGPVILAATPMNSLMILDNSQNGSQLDIYQVATQYEALSGKPGILNYEQMKTTIGFVNAGQLGIQEPNKMNLETSLTIIKCDGINKRVVVLYTVNKVGFNEASGIITIYARDAVKNDDLENVENVAEEFIKIQTTKNKSFDPGVWESGQKVTVSELGINEPEKKEAKINYKIKKIDLKIGQVIVQALISQGLESMEIKIIVDGFKSGGIIANDVDKVLAKLKDQTTTKEQIDANWKVDDEISVEDLGINAVDPLSTQVVYKIKNIDQEKGIMVVTATVSKDDLSKTKDITISGFKNDNGQQDQKDQQDVEKIIANIENKETSKSDLVPSWAPDTVVTEEELGIEKVMAMDAKVEFKVKESSADDKKNGTLPIHVTVTKNKAMAEKDIIINGFMKQDIEKENQNDEVMEEINKIDQMIPKNQKTILKDSLPSQIIEQKVLTNDVLGIQNIDKDALNGININYELISINDKTGEIEIKAIISKGKTSKEVPIKIEGFLILKNFLDKKIDELNNKSFKTNKSGVLKKLLDSIGKILKLSDLGIEMNLPESVDAKMKIDPISKMKALLSGTLLVFISLVKNGIESKIGNIKCEGYSIL